MKLGLVVIGNGRYEYLREAVAAIPANVLHPISARVMIHDAPFDVNVADYMAEDYPEYHVVHTDASGMSKAVQAGFDAILEYGPDYVLWIEEDMVLLRPLSIGGAASAMDRDHTLAQVCFRREPLVYGPDEMAHGDQLLAILSKAITYTAEQDYCTHDYIFSLNPCLIPRRILGVGWDANNEAGMTEKLLGGGYRFASWGPPSVIPPYARHIGHTRADIWQL